MDETRLAHVVDELRTLLTNDGGDLILTNVDRASGHVAVRLTMTDQHCAECLIEPDMLREILRESIQSVPGVRYVEIDDPRQPSAV